VGDRGARRRSLVAALLVVASLVAVACVSGDDATSPTTAVPLDGTPRYPDAEGVVVDLAADFSTITLDGDRTYGIQEDVQSFSSLDGSTQPLLRRKGQYVQVGLRDGQVRWIAGIAAIVRAAGQPPVAYYTGNLVEVRAGKAIFEDGTVLTLGDGIAVPDVGARLLATIDATLHRVVELVVA